MQTKPVQKIFFLSILLFGIWWIVGCGSITPISPSTPTLTSTLVPTSTAEAILTLVQSPTESFMPPVPMPNTIYLVDYEGQTGVFLTSRSLKKNLDNSEIPLDYMGILILEQRTPPANFLDFETHQDLLTITADDVSYVMDFLSDEGSHTLYLSLVLSRADYSEYNLLYKIDLDTSESEVILKKEIAGRPDNYCNGPVFINQVKGPYIELGVLPCFGCSPCPPYGKLILSTETGAKKFLGTAGNVEIDLDRNLISYRMLTIDYACDMADICPCAVEEIGSILTESLPLTSQAALTSLATPTHTLDAENTRVSSKDGMTMMYVPAGEFSMGSSKGFPNERPVHAVYLDAYWIDQTEVTNEMFAQFLNSEGNLSEEGVPWLGARDVRARIHVSGHLWKVDSGYEKHPVTDVSWYGAQAYCKWRENGSRLPTEAEWEKAASWDDNRKEKRIYPWGNDISCMFANYYSCVGDTTEVGSQSSGMSFYGLFDMVGNVAEWVADWYDSDYYVNSPSDNPIGPSSSPSESHVVRGGSWFNNDFVIYSSLRSWYRFEYASSHIGFRCSRDISP